jgi:dipeptidyl aminopeptidase/acylaminoacyl peptidase
VATGRTRTLAEDWDRSPGGLVFSPDGGTLWATASNVGHTSLFAVDVASGAVREVVREGHVHGPAIAASGSGGSGGAGGYRVVFGRDTLTSPVDLYSAAPDGSDVARLTEINREEIAAVRFGEAEQFSFEGAHGDTVYAWVVKPVDFQAGRKVPLC